MKVRARTGAERYFAELRKDPEYEAAYQTARRRIDQIDFVIREIDKRRSSLNLTKAEVARRADLRPEAVRRLLSGANPNPTLSTLAAVADALEMEVVLMPRNQANNLLSSRGNTRHLISESSG